ncbi:MAG: hypothetical protein H7301_12905 [Cryobacterium sp.]|nr:hypothetical protein [Oligoflexia bacterium]
MKIWQRFRVAIIGLFGITAIFAVFQNCGTGTVGTGASGKASLDNGYTTGTTGLYLSLSASSYVFAASSSTQNQTFTLSNPSRELARTLSVSLSSSTSAFTLTGDTCTNASLPAGGACAFQISYVNSSAQTVNGSISIYYANAANLVQPPIAISLTGSGRTVITTNTTTTASSNGSPGSYVASTGFTLGTGSLNKFSSTATYQKSALSCGNITKRDVCASSTPASFDGANCHVGAPPWGTGFIYGGNFYYPPHAGTPCASNHSFDGRNCVFASAFGNSPFIYNNHFYFTPTTRVIPGFYSGICPLGSIFDGANCYAGNVPTGTGQVSTARFTYDAKAGVTPCESSNGDYFDGSRCVYSNIPTGWSGFVYQSKFYFYAQASRACVP